MTPRIGSALGGRKIFFFVRHILPCALLISYIGESFSPNTLGSNRSSAAVALSRFGTPAYFPFTGNGRNGPAD
jgi:hypothetical protein